MVNIANPRPIPLCGHCIETIGGASAGPDLDWRRAAPREACGAFECVKRAAWAIALCEKYERTGCALYPRDADLLLLVFGGPPPGWAWTRYEAGNGGYTNLRRVGTS